VEVKVKIKKERGREEKGEKMKRQGIRERKVKRGG